MPDSLREGSLALGAPQWKVITRVVLPTARAGLLTASILAVARSIGETAPAILTAFGSSVTNTNPFHGPQASLPLMVWDLIRQPNQVQIDRAWTALLILVLFVLVAFTLARWVGSRSDKKLGETTMTDVMTDTDRNGSPGGRTARSLTRVRPATGGSRCQERERLVRPAQGARALQPQHGGAITSPR